MTVGAHVSFSQRPTWPPSAAVRQRSIADMTFIWPRLTWPALAWRHAAPWSRKIAATSSNGRDMAAKRSAGLCCPSLWLSWASYEAATAGQAGSRCRRSGRLRRACSAPSCPICRDPARWAHLPPLSQQIEHLGRQHHVPILAALGLLDANNPLRLVDMLDLQPDHLAGAQAAPIAKTECHAGLEARGNGQHATRLVRAHHLRNLLGLADVIDLGGKIQPPQRHAEQEPHSSHDAVAIADAYARLGKIQLEPADILHSRRLG